MFQMEILLDNYVINWILLLFWRDIFMGVLVNVCDVSGIDVCTYGYLSICF
jgi:hypothetical protein